MKKYLLAFFEIVPVFAWFVFLAIFLMGSMGGGTGILIDDITRAQSAIEYEHHEVHEGDSYFIAEANTINSGVSREYLITTPNTTKWAHMANIIGGTGSTTVYLYESTTKTAGTGLTARNRNRNSSATATLTADHTPGGAGDGTLIFTEQFGASRGNNIVAGSTRGAAEIILKQNTKYLLRITSGTDGNLVTTLLSWYEHTNENL